MKWTVVEHPDFRAERREIDDEVSDKLDEYSPCARPAAPKGHYFSNAGRLRPASCRAYAPTRPLRIWIVLASGWASEGRKTLAGPAVLRMLNPTKAPSRFSRIATNSMGLAESVGVESVAASKLIYASSNGDQWFLARDVQSGQALVRHVPNPASGGESIHIEIDAFLSKDRGSPQRQELMRMIGSLIPEELDPDRI
jgi:hypothetical protein